MTPCWRKARPGGMRRTHVVLATLLALSAQLSNADLRDTALTSDMAILELQRLQAMGPEAHDIVDAMLQGTTTLAVGHSVDSDHFAKHVARCAARADNRALSHHQGVHHSPRPLAAALRAPLVGCVFTMSRTRRRTSRSGVSCSRRNA